MNKKRSSPVLLLVIVGGLLYFFVLGGGGSSSGIMNTAQIEALWIAAGGSPSAAPGMAAIAHDESGGAPGIVQQGQPPGLTGYGLWQITPTSGISQGGLFGNLLNALNNARAAVYLFSKDGFRPWSSDPAGKALCGC